MPRPKNMVLRTVYLPLDLDKRVRSIAFRQDNTPGGLMCDLIAEALEHRKAAGERTFEEEPPVEISAESSIRVFDELPPPGDASR